MKRLVFKIAIVVGVVAIASMVLADGPQPSVNLYWYDSHDPTMAPGMAAPLNQLLVRTDSPSIYYKSGSSNTGWTQIGIGAGGGAGTVTAITCGTGLTCTPNPIIATGTAAITNTAVTPGSYVAANITVNAQGQLTAASSNTGVVSGTGTAPDLTAWTGASTVGNFAGSTPAACGAGLAETATAISASGTLSYTCTAFAPAGNISGTTNTLAMFTSATAVGNSPLVYDGLSTLSTSKNLTVTGTVTPTTFNEPVCVVSPFTVGVGPINNWNPACLATNKVIEVQCADNNGTWITGIDAVDNSFSVGKEVTVCNTGATSDGGNCVFGVEDSNSVASNRIWKGNYQGTSWSDRFTLGTASCVTFRYTQPNQADLTIFRWVPEDAADHIYRLTLQNLNLYPFAQPAAVTGTVQNWDPVPCSQPGYPAGGSCLNGGSEDMADYSLVLVTTVDASGVSIGGISIGANAGGNTGKNEGQIKILVNNGPGNVTIKNQDGGSLAANRFVLPTNGYGITKNTMIIAPSAIRIFFNTGAGGWTPVGTELSALDDGTNTFIGPLAVSDNSAATGASTVGNAFVSLLPTGTGITATPPLYNLTVYDARSFDTTGGAVTMYNVSSRPQATRSAGANALNQVAYYADATGCDTGNDCYAFQSIHGIEWHGLGVQANLFYFNAAYSDFFAAVNVETILRVGGGDNTGTGRQEICWASQAPTSASHGTLSTDASNCFGRITSIGSNTSTTLTFGGGGFGTSSHCFTTVASAPGAGVGAIVYVSTVSATAPVFSCLDSTTGAAANCPDFEYQCWGH